MVCFSCGKYGHKQELCPESSKDSDIADTEILSVGKGHIAEVPLQEQGQNRLPNSVVI